MDFTDESWFTLEDIEPMQEDSGEVTEVDDKLFCLGVDSPSKQFLVGGFGVPTHNTDEGKAEDALKGEASMLLGSIARLGRAAGVHLVLATQRPDATILPGETKANLAVRINCGRSDSNASSMILGNGEGTRIKSNPRGRVYVGIHGNGNHAQGFFAEQTWIDDWLASKGMNPDGTPLGGKRSKLANVVDMAQFSEGDLDEIEGVDNSAIIEKIREEEMDEDYESNASDDGDFSFEDDIQVTAPPADDSGMGRPEFGTVKKDNSDKFYRPEDDWDEDMDFIIGENE